MVKEQNTNINPNKGKQKASDSEQSEQNEEQFASSSSSSSSSSLTHENIQFTPAELARIDRESAFVASSSSSVPITAKQFYKKRKEYRQKHLSQTPFPFLFDLSFVDFLSELFEEHQTQLIVRNKQLVTDLIIADRQRQNLEAENKRLEKDNLSVGNINASLTSKLKKSNSDVEQLRSDIEALNQFIENQKQKKQKELEAQLLHKLMEASQSSSSNPTIVPNLAESIHEAVSAELSEGEVEHLNLRINQLTHQLESANAELEIANRDVKGLEHEKSKLSREFDAGVEKFQRQINENNILQQKVQDLEVEIAQLKTQIRTLQEEKTQLQGKYERAKRRGTVGLIASTSQGLIWFIPDSWFSKEAKEKTNTAIQAWSASELVLSTADWTYEWIILALGFLLFPFLGWLRKRIFGWKEINELQEWKEKYDNLKEEKKELKEKNADLEKELKAFQNDQLNKKKPSSSSDENETDTA